MKEELKHEILEFHPDTLQAVRRACGLAAPGRMDEAIDLLQDWVSKQDHFLKKDFPRIYLEMLIIKSKGSVEKAKQRLEIICTMRTFEPLLFEKINAKNDFTKFHDVCKIILMPKMTDDHCRVIIFKPSGNLYPSFYQDNFQYLIIQMEYLKLHEYNKGVICIADLRHINILEFARHINLIELRNFVKVTTKGYGIQAKSLHFVTSSKAFEVIISVAKQVASAKIVSRLSIQKTLEELHQHVPKRILPEDLGGEGKSINTLHDEWLALYSSEEHINHMREMQDARTDESRRRSQLDKALFDISGTFRALNVD